MPIISPDADDLLALLDKGQGMLLHWFPEDVSLSTLAAVLAGMANTDGGTVVLGISAHRNELVGVRDPDHASESIFHAALMVDPVLVLPLPHLLTVKRPGMANTVDILTVSVPPGLPHVYSLEGRYFCREGNQTTPLSARKLYKLLQQRGAQQFESRLVPDASVADLDPDLIVGYALSSGKIPPGDLESSYEFLIRRGCLKRVDDQLRPTYAALIIFGRFPQQWLPNATILAGRFPGAALSDSYVKRDIIGNLPQQLRQAEEFIRENVSTTVHLVGLKHQESLEYPLEAVRELLVNAVAHRDYNLQGDNIHLNIFNGRLEVSSPGTLPGPVTINNLLEARFARNAVISQVLSDMGYVERLGYGLDRVVESTRTAGLLPPKFEEIAGTFRVTLYASRQPEISDGKLPDLSVYSAIGLNSRQELVLVQLAQRQRISSHQYQALCPGVHPETLRRDLADLVSRGILIKVGDKKSTYYILKRV